MNKPIKDSDSDFERRCTVRYQRAVKRLAGKRWRCTDCGELYGPQYVAYNGRWCSECDHWLEEVES